MLPVPSLLNVQLQITAYGTWRIDRFFKIRRRTAKGFQRLPAGHTVFILPLQFAFFQLTGLYHVSRTGLC